MEKKMFGGVGFLLNGNMACGVHKDNLIVRVDPEKHGALLKKAHARPFDITGRPMKGWLLVGSQSLDRKSALSSWVKRGLGYARSLPGK